MEKTSHFGTCLGWLAGLGRAWAAVVKMGLKYPCFGGFCVHMGWPGSKPVCFQHYFWPVWAVEVGTFCVKGTT